MRRTSHNQRPSAYAVKLRYSEPNPTTGLHDTAQEVTVPVEGAASPEHAAWLAKVQLRMAYRGEDIRIFHWDVQAGNRLGSGPDPRTRKVCS